MTKSHSRPRTSNDNPFSESQFKTMKYCPFFPGRFASIAEGREYFGPFFGWYNDEHHHSGIAMLTPAVVHAGRVDEVLEARQAALDVAYAAHPERFVHGPPRVQRPPAEVWINRPAGQVLEPPSGVAEPPPEASVRPSPTRSVDREGEAQATERPEPPGPTRSAARRAPARPGDIDGGARREHGEDGEDATLPKPSPAVPVRGDGRSEAEEHAGRHRLVR